MSTREKLFLFIKILGYKLSMRNLHIPSRSPVYNKISSGEFHRTWLQKLEDNNFIDKKTKKKIPDETIKLLIMQKDLVTRQLIQFPNLYYAKSNFPLEISKRAFDSIWRMCESYELWCKETKQPELLFLNIID